MLKKLLERLGYIKKEKYDCLGGEFQELAQAFREAKDREEEMETIATALVMFPHTVYKDARGNYIPITHKTLKEAEDHELVVKVDMYNQTILRVKEREENELGE